MFVRPRADERTVAPMSEVPVVRRPAINLSPGERIFTYSAEAEGRTRATVKEVVPRSDYLVVKTTRGKSMPLPLDAEVEVIEAGWVVT